MKSLRLVAIGAILFCSASAFTKATKLQKFDTQTWHLKDSATNPDIASNYELAGSETCDGVNDVCEIMDVAGSNPNQPALSHGAVSTNESAYSATFRN